MAQEIWRNHLWYAWWIYRSSRLGVTTQRDNKLYVHILNLKDDALYLPMQGKKVRSAKVFIDQKPLKFTEVPGGVVVKFDRIPDDVDYVVELEIK